MAGTADVRTVERRVAVRARLEVQVVPNCSGSVNNIDFGAYDLIIGNGKYGAAKTVNTTIVTDCTRGTNIENRNGLLFDIGLFVSYKQRLTLEQLPYPLHMVNRELSREARERESSKLHYTIRAKKHAVRRPFRRPLHADAGGGPPERPGPQRRPPN